MTTIKRKAYRRGLWAERLAAFYLMLKGYRILKMRYKSPVGEIDIIARRKTYLVFVEVKARQSIDDALRSVQVRGQKRIEKAAGHFLNAYPIYSDCDMRFDVIAFKGLSPFSFQHLDNAWQARS